MITFGENNQYHVKCVFWKVFKNSIKLLMSLFLLILQTFFLLKVHSKGNWALEGHSKGIWRALLHLGTQRELGHSGTWPLGDLGSRALKGHLDTQVLKVHYLADPPLNPELYAGTIIRKLKFLFDKQLSRLMDIKLHKILEEKKNFHIKKTFFLTFNI